jgi:hypothetical protein
MGCLAGYLPFVQFTYFPVDVTVLAAEPPASTGVTTTTEPVVPVRTSPQVPTAAPAAATPVAAQPTFTG